MRNTISGNDFLKPSKLKRRKELKHKENTDSVETFKANRARYNMKETLPALGFCLTSQPFLRASCEVSLVIAKAKAPHTAGEKLIKFTAVKMAEIVLGRNEAKRIDSVSLSDGTVNNRIAGIANNILIQHVAQIQDSSGRISLQFDETTDIKSISQLVAYVVLVVWSGTQTQSGPAQIKPRTEDLSFYPPGCYAAQIKCWQWWC